MEQRFPMEQGCSAAGRWGRRAELTMEVPGPGQGLYRGYVLGEGGQMDLGTLLPEGGGRRLHRTVPVAELRKRGCWPVTGGMAVLTYAFSGGSTQSGPRGWTGLDRPETCFPADPVLAQGPGRANLLLPAGGRGVLSGLALGSPAALPPGPRLLPGPGQGPGRAAVCGLPLYPRGAAPCGGNGRGGLGHRLAAGVELVVPPLGGQKAPRGCPAR